MATGRVRSSARAGVLACVVVAAALAAGCQRAWTAPPAPPAAPATEVKVETVQQKDVPISAEWVGTLVGYVDAQIRPKNEAYWPDPALLRRKLELVA